MTVTFYGTIFNIIDVPYYFDILYDHDTNETILQIFVPSEFTDHVWNNVKSFETERLKILVSPGSHKRLVRELALSLYMHNRSYGILRPIWFIMPMNYCSRSMDSYYYLSVDDLEDMLSENLEHRVVYVLKINPRAKELIIEKRMLKSKNLKIQLRRLRKEISIRNIIEEKNESFYYPAVTIHWSTIMNLARTFSILMMQFLNAQYRIVDKTRST